MTSRIVELHIQCPKCPSSDAYCVYEDGHGYCYSCNYFKPSKEEFEDLDYTYEFLPWRGITRETMELYNVRTKIDGSGKPISLGAPWPNGAIQVRDIDEKVFRWERGPAVGLFGPDRFTPGQHKYVTITEGWLDALSIYQATGGPAFSVQSASSAKRDCTAARSRLNEYDRIYLAFDNDAPGREAAAAVATLFERDKVFVVKFGAGCKDANDYVQRDRTQELKTAWWNAKKYLPENISSSLEEFKEALSVPPKVGVPYPFERLTEMTYGIRTGESVLITAQEKVGKTEFMHFILHNLLKETDDAIGALFLEEPKQRTLQALAGVELGKPVHLPDTGVSVVDTVAALGEVVGRDDRLYLYSHFGTSDPEIILDTVRYLAAGCGCKYVIFDHIGMAVSGSGSDNERLALDYISTRLEMMVKELDFALIYVSHVNDDGKTRGSRYLGKLCDVRIDLKRDTSNSDPNIRNTLEVSIPYQRFSPISGPVGSYLFDPWTQKYTEVANDNNPQPVASSKAA